MVYHFIMIAANLFYMPRQNFVGCCQGDVKDHEITSIEILEYKASYMEQATDVCSKQSLDIDAVSGTILTRRYRFESNRKRIGIGD